MNVIRNASNLYASIHTNDLLPFWIIVHRSKVFGSVESCKAGYESFIVLSKKAVPCRLHGRWTTKRPEDPLVQDCIWVRAGPFLRSFDQSS
jgi:hypothetical protein